MKFSQVKLLLLASSLVVTTSCGWLDWCKNWCKKGKEETVETAQAEATNTLVAEAEMEAPVIAEAGMEAPVVVEEAPMSDEEMAARAAVMAREEEEARLAMENAAQAQMSAEENPYSDMMNK